jgi:hypothetical protein
MSWLLFQLLFCIKCGVNVQVFVLLAVDGGSPGSLYRGRVFLYYVVFPFSLLSLK